MNELLSWLLLVLFAMHLVGFSILGLKRRQWYYLALVVTFTLLTGTFALSLFAPSWSFAGTPLYRILRYLAWASAVLSISWTLQRLARRRSHRAAGSQ
jgi:hypothetical protein